MIVPRFLENLLSGAVIEWVPLGNKIFFEVANCGRKPVKSSLRVSGETPYYGANNIQDYVSGSTHEGEYVLIAEDGSASLENYSIQYATGKFWANNHIHVVRGKDNLNTRFLFHYLCIVNFIPFLTGGGRSKLTKGRMIEIPIPIPCPENPKKSLAIKSEIVRVLDTYTELTTELTERKKQYDYYRNQLLTFEDSDVEYKALGEIAMIKTGDFVNNRMIASNIGDYPVINSGREPLGFINCWNTEDDPICIASRGNPGLVTWQEGKYFRGNLNYSVSVSKKSNVEARYLYHLLLNMKTDIHALCTFDGIPALNAGNLKRLPIPIPTLTEQARIVTILDKFDTLTNSIIQGLPHEIDLRKKQFTYYRNLLFNFPKSEENEI